MAVRKTQAPVVPNGFVASVQRLPLPSLKRAHPSQGWMEEGWRHYDTVGELRFVANWVGNVMSRAVLRAAVEVDGHLEVVTGGPAAEALDEFHGGADGQTAMLQASGVHLTVAGEGYHVMTADEQWFTLASGRVSQTGDKMWADFGEGKRPLKKSELCYRVWTPHPRDPLEADSPVRANLSTLRELTGLNQHIAAQLDSRLAGAGILWVPSEITFAAPEGIDPQANQADAFMQVLGETMLTPIKDRGSAAAVVPLVVQAPGEALDKVQHTTFWSPLDAAVLDMRASAVKKLALGLDTPPEVLLGVSDANHWNAWLVDEAAVKSHLEPRLQVITSAVASGYLRPALEGLVPDTGKWHVVADTSKIRLRPDLSSQAIDLYDRGELSGDALRRETGFDPMDRPDAQETVEWLLRKVAAGSTSPEQTVAALRRLGADLGIEPEGGTNKPPPDGQRTDTEPETQPRQPGIGRARERTRRVQDGEAPSAAQAACEALVLRALERVGNKLCDAKQRSNGLGQVPAHERYLKVYGKSLDGVFDGSWTTAETVLEGLVADPYTVVPVLDDYVRGLVQSRTPHTREGLHAVLKVAGVA